MEYFATYCSNTLAGSGNQFFFYNENQQPTRSCTLYQVTNGGEYPYSFLFSNTIDSTFSDGAVSHKNLVVDAWTIEEMLVGVCSRCDAESFEYPQNRKQVLFGGHQKKVVNPAELFCTDAVTLNAKKGEYICVEIVFSGNMIPYHEESIIPSFIDQNGEWLASKKHPFVSMVGIQKPTKKKIAFLGDSITQGIGTPVNSYEHWNAVLANLLGDEYAYWNLGLGYGRADDAASDGIWLYKAKQNDIVFVCYGVNDILQGYSADGIKKNLQTIVDQLHDFGICVIVQTIPPFSYSEEQCGKWREVNDFIQYELKHAALVFDCVKYLAKSESESHIAKYGGHPNSDGCNVWGKALFEAVVDVIQA
ncbi:MAG: SGNH/GDSL hydrolase family protein [Clostridia bacterium]|nr:SGNH/GDSL hydrolase family protein [Clostridia bacterium]